MVKSEWDLEPIQGSKEREGLRKKEKPERESGSKSQPPTKLLTVPEAADLMRVSRRTLERWIRTGEIPRIKLGKVVRIDPSDLEKMIERSREYLEVPFYGEALEEGLEGLYPVSPVGKWHCSTL